MLVLSRKQDQRIVIRAGGTAIVTVTVVEIRGDKVRLGFQADEHYSIHREEIDERIHGERDDGKESA